MKQQRREKFSNRIFQYRKKRGYSQKKLASILGHKDPSQVSKWERGVKIPGTKSSIDLAHALCTPVEFLFIEYSRTSQEQIIQNKLSYE